MKKAFFATFIFASFLAVAQNADDPNYEIEDRFHNIYKKFNESPLSEETWGKVFNTSQPREYSVVKTDTLWDISDVLFADPVFWPKIWSFNTDEVLNPHEIKPGWKIRFFPGTMESAPMLMVVEFEGVAIPTKRKSVPVAQVPPSIPNYKPEMPSFEIAKFVSPDRSAQNVIPPMPLPVELVRDRPDYQGKIVEIEEGAKLADYGREIFVALEPDARPGHYTVIKNIEKNKYGFIIQYRGEVQILDRINDGENVYRARITKMLDSIELNDYLVSGEIPVIDISNKAKVVSAPIVPIIGGFRSPTDLLFSPYSIVFLDGGTQAGFNEGDVMNVYQSPRARTVTTKQKKSYREIGTIKIIRAQEQVSTAYILSSKTEIRQGDFAGLERTESGIDFNSSDDNLNLD